MKNRMEKIKVSVVIAVYNAEKYLKQCLDSLMEQTLEEIEIICVNDGSTDNSLTILEEYKRGDERISIYTQGNQYAGVARNNGLKHVQGEYTLFLDADDFLKKDCLEILYNTAKKADADIVVFGHYRYDTENACTEEADYILEKLGWFGEGIKSAEEIAPFIFNFSEPCAWNKLYRTSFLKDSGVAFMPLKTTNDLFFSYMTLARAGKICVCKEELLYYRINRKSSLQGMRNCYSIDFSLAISELKSRLLDANLYLKFETSFLNMAASTCFYNFCRYMGMEGFKEFHEVIRKFMTQDIGLKGYVPNQYMDQYVYFTIHKIMNLNYDDYLEFERAEKKISHPKYYYYFPFWILPEKKNVVIYGAGNVGKSYYLQLSRMRYCHSLKMTDSAYETMQNDDVCSLKTAFEGETDYVIIAVENVKVKREIEERLSSLGKNFVMLWQKPMRQKWEII